MIRVPAVCALAALTLLAPLGGEPARADEPYPTDRCVSEKLAAAARHCGEILGLFSRFHADHPALGRRLARAEARLARAWRRAEAGSAADGVDCADSTAGSAAVADLVEAGADGIAGSAGARLCRALLEAEAWHLRSRGWDRERERLERRRAEALQADGPGDGKAHGRREPHPAAREEGWRAAVEALVQRVVLAVTVSPHVPTEWTQVTPDAEVRYEGRSLAPICSRGTPWVFFVKRGTVNKLFIHYQGGGACWDGVTCDAFPTYDQAVDPERENPAGFSAGLFDLDNPDNPIRDWHMVFVPYCTGDVHWGDARFEHPDLAGENTVVIEHKGWVNARVAEKWTREHFVHPDQVFVTGSSAGAYGAIVNSLPLLEFVYPSAQVSVLGDAGNGVITQDFLENDIRKWGVEKNLPPWIPALNRPLEELTAADLWVAAAEFYPQARFATYTTAFDGSRGGQTGFFWVMLNPVRDNPFNIFKWLNWWEASCEWNQRMRALNANATARAPNYRYYVGSGSRHTIEFNDKLYDDTTGGVPPFVSWLRAMIAGSPEWVNVECQDCGVLLPGDPAPRPALPPFTADGRIICD